MASFLSVNEHPVERALRVSLGVVLVVLAVRGTLGAWAYIGVLPILTGATGICPLYSVLGFSTCPARKPTA